jgi:hypothetical protein
MIQDLEVQKSKRARSFQDDLATQQSATGQQTATRASSGSQQPVDLAGSYTAPAEPVSQPAPYKPTSSGGLAALASVLSSQPISPDLDIQSLTKVPVATSSESKWLPHCQVLAARNEQNVQRFRFFGDAVLGSRRYQE